MSNIVLSVENLYKQYRLGIVGTGTMRDDLARFWAKIRGKEDPNLKIGEVNDRNSIEGDYVWALQDINFEVKQGEVLGIIGKNGAGKSTLLKILSKVTSPTKGQIKTKGRIASLLEVGTGFHPELTGRENIFLNGAILGMTKNDIRSKFDEIVEFSGIGKYIDTPVKRYSSGMYVRLAFAVAAHLEPEILIIDEVLAVGDAEFQKKCLGKMKDVSGQGRTVLFVSHNLQAIKNLCTQGILMKYGVLDTVGSIEEVIGQYMKKNADMSVSGNIPLDAERYNTGEAKFLSAFLVDEKGEKVKNVFFRQALKLFVELEVYQDIENVTFFVHISNSSKDEIGMASDENIQITPNFLKGTHQLYFDIPNHFSDGQYSFGIRISYYPSGNDIDFVENVYDFEIEKLSSKEKKDFVWSKHGDFFFHTNFTFK